MASRCPSRYRIEPLVASDLAVLISKVPVRTWQYKDRVAHGGSTHLGFIAQELRDLGLGVAVRESPGFVPDVYARAVRVAPGIFETAAPHGLVDGQTIRFFGDAAGPRDAVVQVVSDTAIRLDIDSPDVFIYGAWADDVLSVDYNAVTAAAIGAIQDLQGRVAALETHV